MSVSLNAISCDHGRGKSHVTSLLLHNRINIKGVENCLYSGHTFVYVFWLGYGGRGGIVL